jgi:hypothetical protein
MHLRHAMLPLFGLFWIGPVTALAQTVELSAPATQSPSPSPTTDPETEKKVFDLLESISDQAANLHSSTNRIRASCAIADLIWTRDEKRARSLFTAAIAQLATRIGEIDYSEMESYQEVIRLQQSRQELLLRVAARDPEMAVNALSQTRLPVDINRGFANPQGELALEMTLANLLAARNPATALKLARAGLARGVSWNSISFLTQLYQKDPKSAQAFFAEIVARIKQDNVARNPELANNAWTLLSAFQPPQADEDTYRDLLNSVLASMMSLDRETQNGISMSQNFYYQLERMLPIVEKYAPARSSELRNWSQTVERTLDPQAKMYQDLGRISQTGSVEDMLALAAKYPPEFQNLLYQNAAWKAASEGNYDRANEISGLISDPVQRRQTRDQIEARAAGGKEEGRVAQARALVDKARTVNRKIELITQLANSLAAAGDKKGALELLADGKTLLAATPSSTLQINAQLRLAQTYIALDIDQAFAILQPILLKLNELVSAAAVLDGIDFRYLKEGEWEMPGANNLGAIVTTFDQTLSSLARSDFDRARKLTDQIERPELRTLIQIDLAQVALGGKPWNNQSFGGRIMSSGVMLMN